MKHNTETICDDNGFEILVGYAYEETAGYYEDSDPNCFVAPMVYTELQTVELIVAGRGIDILPSLTKKEKSFIISKLNYQ